MDVWSGSKLREIPFRSDVARSISIVVSLKLQKGYNEVREYLHFQAEEADQISKSGTRLPTGYSSTKEN